MEQFTVAGDGFHGFLHRPERDQYPGRAVIVVGGSEGNDHIPVEMGKLFADSGLTALGLCYWNVPGLPGELYDVPVESVEKAARWLLDHGFQKVAMYGISKGGELTLTAASLLPEIGCVVAVSPLQCVMEGITGSGSMLKKGLAGHSSWTWRGKPLPYAPGNASRLAIKLGVMRRFLTQRQMNMSFLYERALGGAPAEAVIPVERIRGPVLLIAAEHDTMWPSAAACRAVEARLGEHGFPYPVKRLEYPLASHILVPLETDARRAFRVEREHPGECAASCADAFQKTLEFLREWQ